MPWVEKYRPSKLEDLVAHEDIISIITRLIDNDNLPHLLLYGPPGTGKVRCLSLLLMSVFALTPCDYASWCDCDLPQCYSSCTIAGQLYAYAYISI